MTRTKTAPPPTPHTTAYTPSPRTVAAVCRTAATILRTAGWAQRSYRTGEGRVCLVGALRVAVGTPLVTTAHMRAPVFDVFAVSEHSHIDLWHARREVAVTIRDADGRDGEPRPEWLATWNDRQHSVDAVLAVLEATATRLEAAA